MINDGWDISLDHIRKTVLVTEVGTTIHQCPHCASSAIESDGVYKLKNIVIHSCQDCGHEWESIYKNARDH